MTINPTLMYAILAMDSYNRGYGAGIDLLGSGLGDVSLATTLNAEQETIALDSSILLDQNGIRRDDQIGFYAIAYTYGNETIISFRGTDTFVLDPIHGWTLGTGNTSSQQGRMALEFYQAVAGSGNWLSANISLTGHPLGGGLAGYVGAIYDK